MFFLETGRWILVCRCVMEANECLRPWVQKGQDARSTVFFWKSFWIGSCWRYEYQIQHILYIQRRHQSVCTEFRWYRKWAARTTEHINVGPCINTLSEMGTVHRKLRPQHNICVCFGHRLGSRLHRVQLPFAFKTTTSRLVFPIVFVTPQKRRLKHNVDSDRSNRSTQYDDFISICCENVQPCKFSSENMQCPIEEPLPGCFGQIVESLHGATLRLQVCGIISNLWLLPLVDVVSLLSACHSNLCVLFGLIAKVCKWQDSSSSLARGT